MGQPNQPERHHYVPAFYLAEFTAERDRYRGRLRVFDVITGRMFGGSPDNQAFERDFYRVETEDPADALLLETKFSELESTCAPLIRTMNDSGKLPDAEGLGWVLSLLTFQAVRVPAVLDKIERFKTEILLRILKTSVAADWDAFRKQALKIEPTWTDEDIAEIKEGLEERLRDPNPPFRFDQTSLLRVAIQGAKPIGDALGKRIWSLGIAPQGCSLITSDNPVVFQYALPGGPPPQWTPGFGRSDTIVVWPTGPGHALFGAPGPVPREHDLSAQSVAQINTIVARHAEERFYFGEQGFRHLAPPDFSTIIDGPSDVLRRPMSAPTA